MSLPLLQIVGWQLITFIIKFTVLRLAFTALLVGLLHDYLLSSPTPVLHPPWTSHRSSLTKVSVHISCPCSLEPTCLHFLMISPLPCAWDVSAFLLEASSMPRIIYIPLTKLLATGWTGIFFYLSVSATVFLQDRDCFHLTFTVYDVRHSRFSITIWLVLKIQGQKVEGVYKPNGLSVWNTREIRKWEGSGGQD